MGLMNTFFFQSYPSHKSHSLLGEDLGPSSIKTWFSKHGESWVRGSNTWSWTDALEGGIALLLNTTSQNIPEGTDQNYEASESNLTGTHLVWRIENSPWQGEKVVVPNERYWRSWVVGNQQQKDDMISKEVSEGIPQSWPQGKVNRVGKDLSHAGVNPCMGVVGKDCGRWS